MRNDRHNIYGFVNTIAKLGLLTSSPYSPSRFGKIMLALYRDRKELHEEEYGNQWGT